MSSANQRIRDQFVNRHFLACQSSLVEECFKTELFSYDDIANLYTKDYAQDQFRYKIIDESEGNFQAAIYSIDRSGQDIEFLTLSEENRAELLASDVDINDAGEVIQFYSDKNDFGYDTALGEDDEAKYDQDDMQEILEWWLVSDWIADKFKEWEYPVLDNDYGTWYGRCTSGQSIAMDYVIGQLCIEQEILVGQKYEWK